MTLISCDLFLPCGYNRNKALCHHRNVMDKCHDLLQKVKGPLVYCIVQTALWIKEKHLKKSIWVVRYMVRTDLKGLCIVTAACSLRWWMIKGKDQMLYMAKNK